jgi:hypothetical protein
MQTRNIRFGSVLMLVVGAGMVACSSDDTAAPGPGSGGSAGSTGTAGNAGTGGTATTGSSGASGAGSGGGGSKADGGPDAPHDAVADCNVAGISHTAPNAPDTAPPAGAMLVGGYRASGNQIYTCAATAADAGADGGPGGTWVNTATANLFGDNCSNAGTHFFTTANPSWMATDGSTVTAMRIKASPAPGATDAGPTAIAWALLKAVSNTGEGVFANVTYVQRTDTAGGVGPSGPCDPTSDANAQKLVPYTATYSFFTGGNAEAGEAGPIPDGSTTDAPGNPTTDATIDSGSDATSGD